MTVTQDSARFSIAVEDFGSVWPVIREAVQARLPLRNLSLNNKFGNAVAVHQLQAQYVLSSSESVQRLRPFTSSPVTWFRNPYAQLFLVTGEDKDDFNRSAKQQIRAILDRDRDPLSGEWIIAYLRPLASDPSSKGSRKVFEALKSEFSSRKRDRCVRLEALGPRGVITGLEELERLLKEAIKATFEAREKAYDAEVRKLMAGRQEAGWKFGDLFLVKDSLAVMLEAAGLMEDALREYFELEACFLEVPMHSGALSIHAFGGGGKGDDNAALLHTAWGEVRSSVQRGGLDAFRFRQYLFACMARLLMQLQRPTEVAERGLKFVQSFAALLGRRLEMPRLFREAWAFSACMALAGMATSMAPPPPTPSTTLQQGTTGATPLGLSASWRLHRRSTSDFVARTTGTGGSTSADSNNMFSLTLNSMPRRSHSATDLLEEAQRKGHAHFSPSVTWENNSSEPDDSSQMSVASHQSSLAPIKTGARTSPETSASRQPASARAPKPIGSVSPKGLRSSVSKKEALAAQEKHAQAQSTKQSGGAVPATEVDWDLGLPAELDGDWAEAEWGASGLPEPGPPDVPRNAPGQGARTFYGLLGQLYTTARHQLVHMASSLEVGTSAPADDAGVQDPAAFPPTAMVAMSSLSEAPPSPPMPSIASAPPQPEPQQHPPQQQGDGMPAPGSLRVISHSGELSTSSSALPPPPVPSRLARYASDVMGSAPGVRRSDSATSLEQSHAHSTPPLPHQGHAHSRTRGSSLGGDSDFNDTASVSDTDSTETRSTSRSALPLHPRLPAFRMPGLHSSSSTPAASTSAPSTATDPNLGAVELQVGTPRGNASGEFSPPTANGGTDSPRWGTRLPRGGRRPSGNHEMPSLGPAAIPEWLSHWRLKLALSSPAHYQELWVELSLAAAACYSAAGRKRNAALLRAEVGQALAAAGVHAPAAQALARQTGMFLDQRWLLLSATLLPHLASCHRALSQVTPPAICMQLLSLPGAVAHLLDREAIQQELLRACHAPPAHGGAIMPMQNASPHHALASQDSLPIMLGSLMHQPSMGLGLMSQHSLPSFRLQKAAEGAEAGGVVDGLGVLWVQPVRGTYSRFFGQSNSLDEPFLIDSIGEKGSGGAVDSTVGDIITVAVDVISTLPTELPAATATLTLSVLQEMKLVFTPRTAAAVEADPGLGQQLQGGSRGESMQGDMDATPLARASEGADRRPAELSTTSQFTTRWQETEDVSCPLVRIARGSSLPPDVQVHTDQASASPPQPEQQQLGSSPSGSPGSANPHLQRLASGMAGSRRDALKKSALQRSSSGLQRMNSSLKPRESGGLASEALMLMPGSNRLYFQARPLKRGLYALHRLHIHIGKMQLQLFPQIPPAQGSGPPTPPHVALVVARGGPTGEPALGCMNPLGHLREASVLLNVPVGEDVRCVPLGEARLSQANGIPGSGQEATAGWRGCTTQADEYGPGWVSVSGLAAGATSGLCPPSPVLLWIPISAGKAQAERESVRVVPHHTPAPTRELGRSTSLLPPGEPGGLVLSPRAPGHGQQHLQQAPAGPATPCGLAHIDVSAAYTAGCPRSHTARLAVPVCAPFRMTVRLLPCEVLPGEQVASEWGPPPLQLGEASLPLPPELPGDPADEPSAGNAQTDQQLGHERHAHSPEHYAALGETWSPHSPTPHSPFDSNPPSPFNGSTSQSPPRRLTRTSSTAGSPSPLGTASRRESRDHSHQASRRSSDTGVPDGAAARRTGAGGRTVQHHFVLEMANAGAPPQTSVHVFLLGPFTARAGQPVTLCWRLERCLHAPSGPSLQQVQYEVLLKGEGWQGQGLLRGSVALPASQNATATVEAMAVPKAGHITCW
ncbi:hypothetical protein WJX73_006019 [Symbiochloris irregularis]|uniref:TRAPPC10/Trs130 N-terminal domain-containing protein n=1 Tax=Symbiochloris irregularis TaxID=706552 RepID=A0AAW1P7V0_9CHLO